MSAAPALVPLLDLRAALGVGGECPLTGPRSGHAWALRGTGPQGSGNNLAVNEGRVGRPWD